MPMWLWPFVQHQVLGQVFEIEDGSSVPNNQTASSLASSSDVASLTVSWSKSLGPAIDSPECAN